MTAQTCVRLLFRKLTFASIVNQICKVHLFFLFVCFIVYFQFHLEMFFFLLDIIHWQHKSKSGPQTCVLGQRVECCTSWVKRWSAAMDFFQTFFKKTNPLLCKSLTCIIKSVCFEKYLKEIHSCASSFNPRRATFNALP